jgi:hypothetical protein
MEKLVYVLWKTSETPVERFRAQLLGGIGASFAQRGARAITANIADEQADYASHLRITQLDEAPTATLSVWLDTHLARDPFERELAKIAGRMHGYLVLESMPIVNTKHPVREGARVPGICTVALLQKPAAMEYEAWRQQWQGHHTQVAIETQSTFVYIQNVVVRALTPDAPPWTAIVEECFPAEAATDPMVFYAAASKEALQTNQRRMMDSCMKFIDFPTLESHPMSAYLVKNPE